MPIVENQLIRVPHEAGALLSRRLIEALFVDLDFQAAGQDEGRFVKRLRVVVRGLADARQVLVQSRAIQGCLIQILGSANKRPRLATNRRT